MNLDMSSGTFIAGPDPGVSNRGVVSTMDVIFYERHSRELTSGAGAKSASAAGVKPC